MGSYPKPLPSAARDTAATEHNPILIEPDKQVGFLLRKACQRNMAIWQDLCIDSQLTSVQCAALVTLYNQGASSLTTLGRAAAMDPATTRGVVERLRDRRLVFLSDDELDRRKVIVHLNETGRKLVSRMLPVLAEITERMMKPLNVAEQVALTFLLTKIAFADNEESADQ